MPAVHARMLGSGWNARRGRASIQMRPASSALARRIETKSAPSPASEILRLSPLLAAAPLGKKRSGCCGSGTGLGRRSILAIARSSTAIKSYRATSVECGFVVEVAASVGNLAVSRGQCLASANTVVGHALGTAKPLLGGCQLFGRVASPARILNVYTIGGSGEGVDPRVCYAGAPSSRAQRISGNLVTGEDQHPPAALSADLDRLHVPEHLAVRGDLDLPDAPQIYAVGVRMPTGTVTIFGHSTVANRPLPLNRGYPGFPPPFALRKKAAKVRLSRRSVACSERPQRHIQTQAPDLTQLGRLVPIPNPRSALRPRLRDAPATQRCKPRDELPHRLPAPDAAARWDAAETCKRASYHYVPPVLEERLPPIVQPNHWQ